MRLKRVVLMMFEFKVLILLMLLQFAMLLGFGQEMTLNSTVEKTALLRLRASLGIRARDWPKLADPCVSWIGIECRNGRVVEVGLTGLTRTKVGAWNARFDVEALVNLTRLEVFNSTGFALPGEIPEWFGEQLGALQVLVLRSSFVVGKIPASLGGLKMLSTLVLSDNMIDGEIPGKLGNLTRLAVLDLSRNMLTGLVPSLFQFLKNLTHVDLSLNQLSGPLPTGVAALSSLKYLNLSRNSFTSDIPKEFGYLYELVELDLGSNSLSGSIPKSIAALKSLRKVNIGNNDLEGSLSNDMFWNFKDLQFLDLSLNRFEGAVPDTLWFLPELKFLDISYNTFTETLIGFSSNISAPNAILNLSNNLFYGALISQLGKYSIVDFSGNYFVGRLPSNVLNYSIFTRNCFPGQRNQRSLEDCKWFYNEKGLNFDDYGALAPIQPPLPAPSTSKSNSLLAYILAGIFGGIGFIVIVVIVLVLFIKICCKGRSNQIGSANVEPVPDERVPSLTKVSGFGESFSYEQLVQSTENFAETSLIKNGHSGDLFRGVLDDGVHVVIKKADLRSLKRESYLLELKLFSQVSNRRLVPLLGHCLEHESEKFIIYEYMPNGDLCSSLLRKTARPDGTLQSLDWITRSKIAIGVAEGLSYLHHKCIPPLVHRDVQATSILLDDKFEVRLGSLNEVHAQEGVSHKNVLTRLLMSSRTSDQFRSGSAAPTCAYDVYCFGKVLLELVTGQVGISSTDEATAKQWLEQTLPHINIYDKEPMKKIMDPCLILDDDLFDEVWSMAIVARTCLNPKPSKRPAMRHVLQALENPLKVVRDENFSSGVLRTNSSRRSWTAAFFGSWRQGSFESTCLPEQVNMEGRLKQTTRSVSKGSSGRDHNHSSSRQRLDNNDTCPEPCQTLDFDF